jgi:hypothetical protein
MAPIGRFVVPELPHHIASRGNRRERRHVDRIRIPQFALPGRCGAFATLAPGRTFP